ncbi:MAG: AAA family ATPase [Roseburia sp.]|nr:AAA family ATPase [Roseburia sp.]
MGGIAVFGLNGSGKSTLAHALAEETGYFEMDVEDYYFPEQKASRKRALENGGEIETEHLGKIPFSVPRTKDEVQEAIMADIKAHPEFIPAGVTMNWSGEILSRIDIAFWLQAPLEERLERIRTREEKRFGERVLAGGDMFEQQTAFREVVRNRDSSAVEECAAKLVCPVIMLDGTWPVAQNLVKVKEHLRFRVKGTRRDS